MYIKVIIDGKLSCIRREDGACIPICDDNKDYQSYIQWLNEDNIPVEEVLLLEKNS